MFQENKACEIFQKNEHFSPPDIHTYVCVSGGKKCSLFGKLGMLSFLETPVLRFALLPYYQCNVASQAKEMKKKLVDLQN